MSKSLPLTSTISQAGDFLVETSPHCSGNTEARCSSVVERPFMVRRVVGLILHVGLIELFLVLASTPAFNGHGMCHTACGMEHIKEPLLLIGKSNPYGRSGIPLSLSE